MKTFLQILKSTGIPVVVFCGFLAVVFGSRGMAASASPTRAERLDELKRNFPAHVAGVVTDKSDPIVQKTYGWYRDRVARLTVENLPEQLGEIRERLDLDISVPDQFQNRPNVKHGPASHATAQNLAWLKGKLLPYVKRLEQFQRGR